MPIDPQTGEQLPYAGEPGAPAGAPPMPPGGPEAMPPEGAPPPGSPEELEQGMAQEAAARAEAIAAMAPEPEQPYETRTIQTMVDQFNKTVDALGGEALPDVEWTPDGDKWDAPLPPEIFVPIVALNEALKLIEDGAFFDKYGFDPSTLVSNNDVRKVTASLSKMEKDKKLQEAMSQPIGEVGPAEEAAPPPAPGGMSDEDQMLAEGME